MKATGVEWNNGRRGKNKAWTQEIRWPASNPKNIVRVTSRRSDRDCHRKACKVLDLFNLDFLTGWVPVDSSDHADDGHAEAMRLHNSGAMLGAEE